MKGCFVLQRRYAHIGHQIVRGLMQEYGLSEACAYIQVRENLTFLSEQKDVPYTALLLDEDIHRSYVNEKLDLEYLRKLEEDVGNPTLWQYIGADRVIRYGQLVREYPYAQPMYSHHDLLRLAQVYAKRITEFLDREKPDFVFMPQPGGLGTLLLEALAKKRGIITQMIIITGLENRTCVSEGFARLAGVEDIMKKGDIEESYRHEARASLEAFRDKPRPYSRVYDAQYTQYTRRKQLDFLSPKGLVRTIDFGVRTLMEWVHAGDIKHDYTTVKPFYYYLDRIKRKARNVIGVEDLYDPYDETVDYAFFPLHLEPEIALLVQAPFAKDQFNIIDTIAQSLPVGMILYVKEHPMMVAYRTRRFYKALKRIPNVRLVKPSIPGVSLIQGARLVFTIAGSSGFEAARLKKPVISFGEFYYNTLSSVLRCTQPEKLSELVRTQLTNFTHNEDELVEFIAAIFKDSARIDFAHVWAYEHDVEKIREELRDLTRIVAEKVGLKK